jgi:hypothetical protein
MYLNMLYIVVYDYKPATFFNFSHISQGVTVRQLQQPDVVSHARFSSDAKR